MATAMIVINIIFLVLLACWEGYRKGLEEGRKRTHGKSCNRKLSPLKRKSLPERKRRGADELQKVEQLFENIESYDGSGKGQKK